ncbi:MAG: YciI-like protein [Saprospiraceae bacterium]
MYYILFYELADDYLEKRVPLRPAHLAMAEKAREAGQMVMAGALANPPDGALLVFKGDGPEVAEAFAKNDPYVQNGLIKKWYVREWTVVVGG